MNVRERFHAVLNADPTIDCCPIIEWASWWDKTINFWEEEGLEKNLGSLGLFDYFGLDRNIQFWVRTKLPECPAPTSHGAPLITNEADYKELKPLLLPKDAVERILPHIEKALLLYEAGSAIVWYTLEGFFWFPRELFGIEPHFYSFYDYPELYHRICEDLLDKRFLLYVNLQFFVLCPIVSSN